VYAINHFLVEFAVESIAFSELMEQRALAARLVEPVAGWADDYFVTAPN
jgi:hypothetical protein